MNSPKILEVIPTNEYHLIVKFDNNQTKIYDVTRLFSKSMFEPLKNIRFFKSVQIERGGYAVVWNEGIDISEYELWSNGQVML